MQFCDSIAHCLLNLYASQVSLKWTYIENEWHTMHRSSITSFNYFKIDEFLLIKMVFLKLVVVARAPKIER